MKQKSHKGRNMHKRVITIDSVLLFVNGKANEVRFKF